MALPYIPTTDAGVRDWLNNFSTLITATPTAFGLTSSDALAIATVASNYNAAYLAAVNPSTRTRATVAAKDAQKAAALFVCRPYAMRINANNTVTNSQREALGITVRDTTPTRLPAPTTHPLLECVSSSPNEQLVRFSDELTPASRSKPFPATALLLFRSIGTAPGSDPNAAAYVGSFTKNPLLVPTNNDDVGKIATYFGRWVNRKGQVGPFSAAASLAIA